MGYIGLTTPRRAGRSNRSILARTRRGGDRGWPAAHILERIPEVGDQVDVGAVDREGDKIAVHIRVLRMEGHRVDRLHIECRPAGKEDA